MHDSNDLFSYRETTPLQSISRTVRHSMHSARSTVISIPSAAPSPPIVSRPVSFGSFLNGDSQHTLRGRKPTPDVFEGSPILSPEILESVPRVSSSIGEDPVSLARWDTTLPERRFLLLGYRMRLQIWDCSDLGCLSETLNVSSEAFGGGFVVHAALIPSLRSARDPFRSSRPLLGILLQDPSSQHCTFVLYSLRTQRVVKKHRFTGVAIDFTAADTSIVLVR